MTQFDVISFLSDLGTDDESVGVCKAIMMQQAPESMIIDITHSITPFDVRAGALALTRAIQFLPTGVVLAAVDPGAPRDQRYIAVELEHSIFVGPDNGLLAPAAQLLGEPLRVHEITNPEYRIEAPGGVFAARDIMAPAAGVIASGVDISELGNAIPLEQLVPGMLQLSRHDEGGAFLGEVWSIDRFGNVQTNITPEEMTSAGLRINDSVIVRIGQTDFMVKFVERYADLAKSQLGMIVDSTGMLSVVKNLDFAATELGVKEGSALAIMPQGATITGRDITVEKINATSPQEDSQGSAPALSATPAVAPDAQMPTAPAAFEQPAAAQVAQAPMPEMPLAPKPTIFEAPQTTAPTVFEQAPIAQAPIAQAPAPTAPVAFEQAAQAPAPAPAPAPSFFEQAPVASAPVVPEIPQQPVVAQAVIPEPVAVPMPAPAFVSEPTVMPLPADAMNPAPAPQQIVEQAAQVFTPAPVEQAPQVPSPSDIFQNPSYEAVAPVADSYMNSGTVAPAQIPSVAQAVNPYTPAPVEQAPLSEAQNVFTSPTYVPEAAPAPSFFEQAPVAYEQAVPAPAPQQQPVDQIPSGNVFDLFKIDDDTPASSDNDDPFSPAQK